MGYTTLTICQALYKTSTKSFHSDEVGKKSLTSINNFSSHCHPFFCLHCHKRLCTGSTCPQTLVTGMSFEDDILVLYLYCNVYHLEYSFLCCPNAIKYTPICFEYILYIRLAMLQI